MKLTSYTGQTIPVLGLLNVTTQYKGHSAQVPIVVVAGEMQNLLGRNFAGQESRSGTCTANGGSSRCVQKRSRRT